MALTKIDDRGLKTPVDLLDNEKLRFGTGNDVEIFHDGSDTFFKSETTGSVYHKARVGWYLGTNATSGGSDKAIHALQNGAVELYHDDSKKFETTSYGSSITGRLNVSNISIPDYNSSSDLGQIRIGTSNDLILYHDGTNSYIQDQGAGELRLRGTNIRFSDNDGSETFGVFNDNGGCELYYDNSKKFHTHNTGATITGYLHFGDGGSTVSGIGIGNSDDMTIYHDGSNSYVKVTGSGLLSIRQAGTGNVELFSNVDAMIRVNGGETAIDCNMNSSVDLYFDNAKKFSTTSYGAAVIEDEFRIGTNSGTGADTLLRIGSHGSNADTHGVIYYDGDDNYLSLLVSGESHGGGGIIIANGGNVGIGTTTPGSYASQAKELVVKSFTGGNAGITIDTVGTNEGSLFFANGTSQTGVGRIVYNHSHDNMTLTTNGDSQFTISSTGNLKWKAHSSSQHVWTRKSFGELSLSANQAYDIQLSAGFTNNTIVRVDFAYTWNDGNGGGFGTGIAWKHHDANWDSRFLAEEIASPVQSVAFVMNGNNLYIRVQMVSGTGMNGRYMLSVDHSSPNQVHNF